MPMSPQPAPKTDEIITLFNELNQSITQPSSFELARLDSAIRRLGDADVAASQCFRGLYHALQGDLENTTKWFNMALATEPNNPDIYMNYTTALLRLQQQKQALKTALECVNKGGCIQESIHNVLLRAYHANDHAVMDAWLPKYENLTGSSHEVASWLQEDAEDKAELPAILKEAESEGYVPLSNIKEELGL